MYLISKREDLLYLIGPAAIGYIILALLVAGVPAAPFAAVMLFVLEGPHAFATVTRTYADPEARRKLRWLLLVPVPLLFVASLAEWLNVWPVFGFFAFTWLHWHVSKQHIGIVMLYKRKASEYYDKTEYYFLAACFMMPVVWYWLAQAGLPLYCFPAFAFPVLFCFAGYVVLQYMERQSIPKLLLLSAVVPLQWLAFLYASTKPGGIWIAGIITALTHSIQYHRLTVRYLETGPDRHYSALGRLLGYAVLVILLNLILNVFPRSVGYGNLVYGVSFAHFIFDGYIWKTADFPRLRAAFGLQ